MSLRARLLAGLIALTAAGLAIAGIVTYTAERSFLISRTDQVFNVTAIRSFEDLLDAKLGLHRQGGGPPPGGGPQPGGGQLFGQPDEGDHPGVAPTAVSPPVGTYGIYISASGTQHPYEFAASGEQRPALPRKPPISTPKHPRIFTVGSDPAGIEYHAIAEPSDTGSGTTVIAVPLTDVSGTLTRLRDIELIVIAGVLLALAALAWLLIRLGLALNAMLGQIEQAFGERQASEDRLRRFLSDASHELRTPLTSIRGYAELFRMGATASTEDTEKAMARIEEEATRMGILVEDLLALARLDEMPRPRREPVDLEPLARDAADDTRAAAREREVTVTLAGEHIVSGDPSQLRQVLANLMRNALTHTPAGSPIELSLTGENGSVRIEVRDHGPGLPQGSQDSVFERFWRSETGRERGKAGAGLGLAIVAAIVAAHGGKVSADNAPGGGAVFTIELAAPAAP